MSVRPCKEKNAIAAVAVAFEFESEFTAQEYSVLEAHYPEFEGELPNVAPHNVITFNMTPGASPTPASQGFGGVTYSRPRQDGSPEWSFTMQANQLIVRCTEYTRWVEIWGQVQTYIQKLALNAVGDKLLRTISLEYLDEFIIGEEEQGWQEQLFKQESKYLQSYIFDLDSFWHTHSGSLAQKSVGSNDEKVLNTINMNYFQDDRSKKKFHCSTQHKLIFQLSGKEFAANFDSCVIPVIEGMHGQNKDVMKDIFSVEILKAIGLE